MKDALYVLQGDQPAARVLVEETGRVMLPLSVDGYACVTGSHSNQLVIALPINTLADLTRVLNQVVPLAASTSPTGSPPSDPLAWLTTQISDQSELARAVAFYSLGGGEASREKVNEGSRSGVDVGVNGGNIDPNNNVDTNNVDTDDTPNNNTPANNNDSIWSHVIRFMAN